MPPSGKNVKKPRSVGDNRLASTSYDHDIAAAGSENDEDADYNELRDSRSELEESVRNETFTNRKRKGIATVLWKCLIRWHEKLSHWLL